MIAISGSEAPGVKLHPEMVFDLTGRPGLRELLKELHPPGVKLARGLSPTLPAFSCSCVGGIVCLLQFRLILSCPLFLPGCSEATVAGECLSLSLELEMETLQLDEVSGH